MSKLKMLAMVILITLVSGSCKKDYPKDIPDWLKDKIKAMNKESKGIDCRYDICQTVNEYRDGNSTFYWLKGGGTPISYTVFDSSGNLVCVYQASNPGSCPNLAISSQMFIREIWTEH